MKLKESSCPCEQNLTKTKERYGQGLDLVSQLASQIRGKILSSKILSEDALKSIRSAKRWSDLPEGSNIKNFVALKYKQSNDQFPAEVYKFLSTEDLNRIASGTAAVYELQDEQAQADLEAQIDWNRLQSKKVGWFTIVYYHKYNPIRFINYVSLLERPKNLEYYIKPVELDDDIPLAAE